MMQSIDTHTAVVLSWMLTYLIHSTILVLGMWLLVRGIKPVAKRISPRAENLGWKLALVGGLITATVQVAAGVTPMLGALELQTGPREAVVVPAAVETRSQRILIERNADVVVGPEDEVVMLGAGIPVTSISPIGSIPTSSSSSSSSAAAKVVETEAAPLWPKLVLAAWLLGVVIALGRLLLSVVRLRRRLADRTEVLEDPVLESFLTLCRDADVRRKIRLTQSTQVDSPLALWRKEVVVPERAVEELSPPAMRAVLAHELAHLERRDPHWLAFAAVLEALFLFQPLNRLARRGMQESAELLCDDWAIAQTGDGVQFAKSLAELASWTRAQSAMAPQLVATMISGERPLVRRVRRALDGDPRRFAEDEPRPLRLLLGLGSLCALIMVAPGAVDASPPTGPSDKAAAANDNKETRAQKKARKAQEKLERDAAAAAERARKAQEAAARALAEAEAARAEAERQTADARREVSGQHFTIRDGDDYLIIDENGVRLHSKDADIDVQDGANPRMRVRIHDGETDLDLDVNLDTIEGLVEGLIMEELGREFGQGFGPGVPPGAFGPGAGVPGPGPTPPPAPSAGVNPDAWDAWAEAMEAWAEDFEGGFDEESMGNELDQRARELERRARELEQRERELERRERQRGSSRGAPPAPPAPPAKPALAPLIPA